MRQVRTANGKTRPKKVPASSVPAKNKISPKQKSRRSESKASRNMDGPGVDNSFDRSKEDLPIRDASVSSHCKCSINRRDYNTLQENSVDSRNCPIHTAGSDYSGGGAKHLDALSFRSPVHRRIENIEKIYKPK
jgi:hypothetical protein